MPGLQEVFERGFIFTGVNVKRIKLASLAIRLGRDSVVKSCVICSIFRLSGRDTEDVEGPSGIIRARIKFFLASSEAIDCESSRSPLHT